VALRNSWIGDRNEGELGIESTPVRRIRNCVLKQEVQTVTRDSEKLLISLYLPPPSNSIFFFCSSEENKSVKIKAAPFTSPPFL
jgi:hypothetical protein